MKNIYLATAIALTSSSASAGNASGWGGGTAATAEGKEVSLIELQPREMLEVINRGLLGEEITLTRPGLPKLTVKPTKFDFTARTVELIADDDEVILGRELLQGNLLEKASLLD